MPKNFVNTLVLILLTGLVYIAWRLAYPSVRDLFLERVSRKVESLLFPSKKRRSLARNN